MKTRLAIAAAAAVFASPFAGAQHVTEEIQPDAVLDAIHEFNKNDPEKPKEVIAVLDDVGVSPVTGKAIPKATIPAPEKGKQPEAPPTLPTDPDAAVAAESDTVAQPPAGLAVRVEKLQTTKGTIDPATVKLLAPFPAKPLSQPPAGWHLDASESAPPFTREVEISPGSKITLTIHPHLLVPDADGANVFVISEPGYDGTLGYRQTSTVGAVLSNSLHQMDADSKQLGAAIDSLEQLLISLPKPETQPEVKSTATLPRKR